MTIIVDFPYIFDFHTAPFNSLEYTPIAINWSSSVLDALGEEVTSSTKGRKARYSMMIHPPRSSNLGVKQHLPDSVFIPLGSDNTFRYQLKPSSLYYPFGRYQVEYFKHRCQIPLDRQDWLIPPIPSTSSLTFTYSNEDTDILLPFSVWSVKSVNPTVNFVSEYNRLTLFADNLPSVGTPLRITYEPAITLDGILEYSRQNLQSVNKRRPY